MAAENDAGKGCPAGMWPSAKGACSPAGADPEAMKSIPPLEALPPLDQTRFCGGDPVRVCGKDEKGCGPGQMPALADMAGKKGDCIPVGVPWTCPPGFIKDPNDPQPMPRCIADPSACPTSKWPAIAAGQTAIYVDASAALGGNGSKSKPFTTIHTGMKLAPVGAVVAVAAGTYTGGFAIGRDVQLRGVCAAKVTVKAGTQNFVLGADNPHATKSLVAGVRITGNTVGVLVLAKLALRRVWVDSAREFGVWLKTANAHVEMDESVVAGTRHGVTDGIGFSAEGGSSFAVGTTRISRNTMAGVTCAQKCKGSLDRVLIDNTRSRKDKRHGRGLIALTGGRVVVTSSRLHKNRATGILTVLGGSHVELRASIIDGTLAEELTGKNGAGIEIQAGTTVALSGVRLAANRGSGLTALGKGAAFVADGLIVDGTTVETTGFGFGSAVATFKGSSGKVHSARLSANPMHCALSFQSSLEVTDALCDATYEPAVDIPRGIAFIASDGQLDLARVRVVDTIHTGIGCVGAGARVRAFNVEVRGCREGKTANAPLGIGVLDGRIDVAGATLIANEGFGLSAIGDGARLQGRGVLVRDTRRMATKHDTGLGATAQDGGLLELAGSVVDQATHVGVAALNNGRVRLFGTTVTKTRGFQPTKGLGWGVHSASVGSELALVSSRIVDNNGTSCGLYDGKVTIDGSVIANTKVGSVVISGDTHTVADGILLVDVKQASVRNTIVTGHQRVGILAEGTNVGDIARVAVSNSGIGIALSKSKGLALADNLLTANQTNLNSSASLPVPKAPAVVKATLPNATP